MLTMNIEKLNEVKVIQLPQEAQFIKELTSNGERRTSIILGYNEMPAKFNLESIINELTNFDFAEVTAVLIKFNSSVLFSYSRPAEEYQFDYKLTNPKYSSLGVDIILTEEIMLLGV